MQPLDFFLILLLGHLIADFLLQSDALVRSKKDGSLSGFARHGLAHALATLVPASIFAPALLRSWTLYLLLAAICILHLLIDAAKIHLIRIHKIADGLRSFLADQLLHCIVLAVAAMLYARASIAPLFSLWAILRAGRVEILAVLIIYLSVVVAGGYAIRYLLRPLLRGLPVVPEETHEQLRNAGLYIGWLERIVVITAVLLRSPATVGLVLTAKSIVRYPEIKSGRFAEYFLIGTLLSILFGLLGGILLLNILCGTVRFSF